MNCILILGTLFIFLYIIGIEPVIVESGSMSPNINKGGLVFINKKVKYESIKENDIIAFSIEEEGTRVTHRAIAITDQGIETKGDANNVSDGISTTRDNYVGKIIFYVPKVGNSIKKLQTRNGKIVCGTVVAVIFVLALFLEDTSKVKKKEKEAEKKVQTKE